MCKTAADAVRLVEQAGPPGPTYDEVWYAIHSDHLGTPQFITDATQTLVWSQSHSAFGETAPNEDPDGDSTTFTYNQRFPGQYFDQESGLHYNYFRDYDPQTGRYGCRPAPEISPTAQICDSDGGDPYPSGYCPPGDCAAYPESMNNAEDRECLKKCRTEKVWIDVGCSALGAEAGTAATAITKIPVIGGATSVGVSQACGMVIEMLVCECDEVEMSCPVE